MPKKSRFIDPYFINIDNLSVYVNYFDNSIIKLMEIIKMIDNYIQMATYTYSLSSDFPGGLNTPQLQQLITDDTNITVALDSIDVSGDNVAINFVSTLSPGEVSELNSIIASYVFIPPGTTTNTDGYLVLSSSLADSQAIQINASNPAGGIYINAGTGGLLINTTNAIGFNAQAQSNFTTSVGNLIFRAVTGLVSIFSPDTSTGGINIGTDTTPVVNVGNSNGATTLNVNSGTGGINLASTKAAADGIKIDASGTGGATILTGSNGFTASSTGSTAINSTGTTAVDAGTAVNIGGTAGVVVNIGNNAGGTAVNIDANWGALNIGNNSTQPIRLGSVANGAFTSTQISARTGIKGFVKSQQAPITAPSSPMTVDEVINGLIVDSAASTLTLPTASAMIGGIALAVDNDSIDFSIINTSGSSTTLTPGTGGTSTGSMIVNSGGSGFFRLVISVSGTSYAVYRLA